MFWGTFFFMPIKKKKKSSTVCHRQRWNRDSAQQLCCRYKMPGDVKHGWAKSVWKKCAAKQIRLNASSLLTCKMTPKMSSLWSPHIHAAAMWPSHRTKCTFPSVVKRAVWHFGQSLAFFGSTGGLTPLCIPPPPPHSEKLMKLAQAAS